MEPQTPEPAPRTSAIRWLAAVAIAAVCLAAIAAGVAWIAASRAPDARISGRLVYLLHPDRAPDGEVCISTRGAGGAIREIARLTGCAEGVLIVAPDARRALAMSRDRRTVWCIDLATGARTGADAPAGFEFDQVASWAPDSRRAACVLHRTPHVIQREPAAGVLAAIDVVLQTTSRITGPIPALGSPAWSRDGRAIAVTTAAGIELVSVEDGRRSRIVPMSLTGNPRHFAMDLAWSPDGAGIAYTRWTLPAAATAIEYVRVADGAVRALVPDAMGPVAWSPDGGRVAYAVDDIRWIDVRTGKTGKLWARNPSDSLAGWAVDGRAILMLRRHAGRKGASQLFLVAAPSGKPTMLVRAAGSIGSAAWVAEPARLTR